jgi:UDP-N-acetyl-D-glucosamine dehydrogenase
MPGVVVSIVADALNEQAKSLKGSVIVVLGVAYKRDVHDTRESPALEIIRDLSKRGASVLYHDPYVPQLEVGGRILDSVGLDDVTLRSADCVLILTDHAVVDYKRIVGVARLVVDTRNATAGLLSDQAKVVRL